MREGLSFQMNEVNRERTSLLNESGMSIGIVCNRKSNFDRMLILSMEILPNQDMFNGFS